MIPNKLHFVCSEMPLSRHTARYYARWMKHAKLYHVYIWVRALENELVIDPLLEAVREVCEIDIGEPIKRISRTIHTVEFEVGFSGTASPLFTVSETVPLKSMLARTIALTEVERWDNSVMLRRFLRLGALYREGGVALEECVQPVGPVFTLGLFPPHEVLFYMHPGEVTPVATDLIIASVPKSEKLLDIIKLFERRFDDEYLLQTRTDGSQFVSRTVVGNIRKHHMEVLKRRIDRVLHRGVRNHHDEEEYRWSVDKLLDLNLVRADQRTGVAVLNFWLQQVQGIRINGVRFMRLVAQRQEDVILTNDYRVTQRCRLRRRAAQRDDEMNSWYDPHWFDNFEEKVGDKAFGPYPEEYRDIPTDDIPVYESDWGYVPPPMDPLPLLPNITPADHPAILLEELNEYSLEHVMGIPKGALVIEEKPDGEASRDGDEYVVL